MSEKPLHVQVAEALGWTRTHYRVGSGHPCPDITIPDPEHLRWKGRDHKSMLIGDDCTLIPRYDIDWSVTGPLIERLGFRLIKRSKNRWPYTDDDWMAEASDIPSSGGAPFSTEQAASPLVAVCLLVVRLYAEGKLPLKVSA